MFHAEQCVFCRFLSQGTSHEISGHPCEKYRVAVGCRNTVFGTETQEARTQTDAWREAGIHHFRL
jgi:putative protease